MNWATMRKLQYVTFFFLFIGIFGGIPAYYILHNAPTCFDNKQNQGEEDIDCGGPCIKLCRPLELRPVVQWEQTFEVVPGVYTAVAYVQNPNVHAESKAVEYTFTFYDSNNTLMGEKKGVAYIPPGKSFPILETGIKFSQKPTRTFFELSDNYTWMKSPTYPEITVKNLVIADATTSPTVSATIINPTFTSIRQIQVGAIVYDSEGNAIAASRTIVYNLVKQTQKPLLFTWPRPFETDVARVEIVPIIYLVK